MIALAVAKARYLASRSPRAVARRLLRELRARLARRTDVRIARNPRGISGHPDIDRDQVDELWSVLAAQPYATSTSPLDPIVCDSICDGERARVIALAEKAVAREVNLLGSGPIQLGRPIDWLRDHKSDVRWGQRYAPAADYAELNKVSDVKFPWELSRLQWLVPVGQAFLLTGDERYAVAARDVLDEWMTANPYSLSVNWAIAMEAALRIVTWTWLFHVFSRADAWTDRGYRQRFISALFSHGDFVERHLERSDVNGNHFIANALGLVFAGLFFRSSARAQRWAELGWQILSDELPRQVRDDGVDFESSTAYHRFVMEMFLLPAGYRKAVGLRIAAPYRERLCAMASFVASYSRQDGSSPYWGDADDGRVLPFGAQAMGDHRYLIGLVACTFSEPGLNPLFSGSRSEILWTAGALAARSLPDRTAVEALTAAFATSGVYVMRSATDHVFIDCGEVGMGGRGGHGHNDCLSFELVMRDVPLVTDAGSYVYTASREWRNQFRGTSFHNTPLIDGVEQNRLLHPDLLWLLRNDARPIIHAWATTDTFDRLVASHVGYTRLKPSVEPTRTFLLAKDSGRLFVRDTFAGAGTHSVRVPFHLAPGVRFVQTGADRAILEAEDRQFHVGWGGAQLWTALVHESWVSPSYGVKVPASCLEFRRDGVLQPLLVIFSHDELPADLGSTGDETLDAASRIA